MALFVPPTTLGGDWITTLTSVAIYSVVTAGLGVLYGRVGMISLGQVACWRSASGRRRDSTPPATSPSRCSARHRRHHLRGRRPHRPTGHAAQRALSGTHHLDGAGAIERRARHARLPERRRRVHGPQGIIDLGEPPAGARPSWARATPPSTATWSSSLRCSSWWRSSHVREQARPCLGGDPGERARGARRRRQHHDVQDVGVRAGVVHDGRRRVPARLALRQPDRQLISPTSSR